MSDDGKIHLSASGLGTDKDCTRKWGFFYIDRISLPSTAAMTTGTMVHKVAEEWLLSGATPPNNQYGKIFVPGMVHLPTPSPELGIEKYFKFYDGEVVWRGFIDCLNPENQEVIDHKVTGSFRWASTSISLATNIQAILYAKYAADEHGWENVTAKWVYYLSKGAPEAMTVEYTFTKEELDSKYAKLHKRGLELLQIKRSVGSGLEIDQPQFPHEGCRAYGGCRFYKICSEKEEGKSTMSDLLKKLQGMNTAKKEPAKPKPEKPATATAPAPAASAINPPTTAEASCEDGVDLSTVKPATPTRGRPKGSKNKKKEEPAEVPTNGSSGYVLFIDCLPVGGAESALAMCLKAASVAAQDNGVAHYRNIEFGQGPAGIQQALDNLMKEEPPQSNRLYVDSTYQVYTDALPVLEAYAKEVIKGTK